MKVVAIVQARMGSTRLPGKMMMEIIGKPIIAYVIEQVKKTRMVNEVWLATTISPEDDVLKVWTDNNQVRCFRGSVNDVLDRYYKTAVISSADVVVRITGDCPLIDASIIDQIVERYIKEGGDYVCNTQPPTFPDGLDTEVFSFVVLEQTWREARLKSEREHVTPYIWKHPDLFLIKNIVHYPDLSEYRWTLDTKEDFEFIRIVLETCKNKKINPSFNNIIELLTNHPEWNNINGAYKRNEGYQKSLQQDINRDSK